MSKTLPSQYKCSLCLSYFVSGSVQWLIHRGNVSLQKLLGCLTVADM
jgi:hypothetical protein